MFAKDGSACFLAHGANLPCWRDAQLTSTGRREKIIQALGEQIKNPSPVISSRTLNR